MVGFAAQLKAFRTKTVEPRLKAVRYDFLLAVAERLVENSPIGEPDLWQSPPHPGYEPGHFKWNWQYSYGAPATDELPGVDADGTATYMRIASQINPNYAGRHHFTNNVPYGPLLANGYSWQAPAGWIDKISGEMEGMLYDIVRKHNP